MFVGYLLQERKSLDLCLLHEVNTYTLVHLQSDMNVEMDIRNQIFRYICRELKSLAEFLLKRLSGAACDRITEEDST
jgi:hypothetical protein